MEQSKQAWAKEQERLKEAEEAKKSEIIMMSLARWSQDDSGKGKSEEAKMRRSIVGGSPGVKPNSSDKRRKSSTNNVSATPLVKPKGGSRKSVFGDGFTKAAKMQ